MAITVPMVLKVFAVLIAVSHQQEKARSERAKAAAAAAANEDAAKGFELVTEGEIIPIPIVYGRAKIAGVRVWQATASRLLMEATTADNYIGTFDSLPQQSSTGFVAFVHPGTDNFRVTFDAGVQAQLVGAHGFSKHVALYTSNDDDSALRAPYRAVVTNVDTTGFNVNIQKDNSYWSGTLLASSELAGTTFYFKVPYTTAITTLAGELNEYLFMQQVLCQGPINRIYDISFNDTQFIDDPALASTPYRTVVDKPFTKGVRADCYPAGGAAHNIVARNFSQRSDAVFTGLASASVIIKLDRNAPQFSDIPNTAFYVEGKKIHTITKTGDLYALSGSIVYSNNPALCLLDYLMSDVSGKGLNLEQLDLKSFYDVAALCDKVVQTNVVTGGKTWQPTDGWRNVTRRDLPLYECNLTLDVKKTVRSNVETILSTMGDARLIWSGGQYKLTLQYPGE